MEVDYLPDFATEGTLEDIPLPVLIAHILDEKLTGTLHIEHDEKKSWIYFEDGFPAGVQAAGSQDFLGQVLRELGFIDDAAFNESLMNMAKTKRLQGELLLEAGAIDDEQLERALSLQQARKLSRLFALRSGKYSFAEDEDIPPPMEPIRVNPYALIYNGIKNAYSADDLKKGLEPLVGLSCKVSGLFIERKELFEFPEEDMADAELLREFRLPQEFVRGTKSGATSGMMMLLALMYCGMLELEEAEFAQPLKGVKREPQAKAATARPAAGAKAAGRPAPGAEARAPAAGNRPAGSPGARRKNKVSAELVKKINDKYEQAKSGDLWHVLEVEHDASVDVVKRSFITLAKVYHPDRVSGAGDEELSHRMDVIFRRINEAHQVLSDPGARTEYDKKAAGGAEASEPRPQEAKVQFHKAQVFLKKKDFTKAAEAIRWAIDMDPKNGDYKAYDAWITFMRNEKDSMRDKKNTLRAALLELAKEYKESFHTFRFLANVCKDLKDDEGYFKALKVAHAVNPKDVGVSRELRLFKIRKEKESKGWLRKKFTK